ncbi:MAG TPA: hypothetical protein PK073_10275 [Ignavibacteriaceae bacterium]|nr:MAG: hypothetical protein BWY38_00006 [Ignavibacteria bacterium ADurb.Bin266]OQY70935.1 MAG: hypothetical protein B6D44_14255 [Ignavibacteriales bacterium UTCHB2]HQF43285.1 hypothetical protein [Ignavibacteriaceae bacterium]HQI40833.1 hypothetical protein [Ignavibacteriaceae bacterium]
MKILIKLFAMFVFVLSLTGCSSTQALNDLFETKIIIKEIEAWLNLMPGGPGSFHITGKYFLSDELADDEVFLDKVIITEGEQTYYNIKPEIHPQESDQKGLKEFQFYNSIDTSINPMLRNKDKIDVKLIFSYNKNLIEKSFRNVQLNKVY